MKSNNIQQRLLIICESIVSLHYVLWIRLYVHPHGCRTSSDIGDKVTRHSCAANVLQEK